MPPSMPERRARLRAAGDSYSTVMLVLVKACVSTNTVVFTASPGYQASSNFSVVRRPEGAQLVPFEVEGVSVIIAGSSPIPNVPLDELPTLSKRTVAFLVEAPAKIAAVKLAETIATRELQSGRVPMPPPGPGAMQVVRAWSGVLGSVSFNFRPGQFVEDPRVQEMVADLHILGPIGSPLQQSAPLQPGQIRILADVNGNLSGHYWNAPAGKIFDDADGALARIFEANRVPIERPASAAA